MTTATITTMIVRYNDDAVDSVCNLLLQSLRGNNDYNCKLIPNLFLIALLDDGPSNSRVW